MKLRLLFSVLLVCLSVPPLCATEILPLAGEWRFAIDRSDVGTDEQWFAKNLPDKIRLPGILQSQGYGDEIRTDTPWVLTLGDAWWKIQPAVLREHFSQPAAWKCRSCRSRRNIISARRGISATSRFRRTGADGTSRCFSSARTGKAPSGWTSQEIPANNSLVAPHVTDLGELTPGKHRLTIRVDNRTQLPAAGHLVDVAQHLRCARRGVERHRRENRIARDIAGVD